MLASSTESFVGLEARTRCSGDSSGERPLRGHSCEVPLAFAIQGLDGAKSTAFW